MKHIPIVDVTKISLSRPAPTLCDEDLQDVGIHLHSAFTQCGFVYLTNHGIDSADVSRVFDSSKTFFHLSNDQKRQSLRDQVTTQGWVQPGQEMLDALKEENGQQAIHELRESFDVVTLASDSMFPDQLVPELRPAITKMSHMLIELASRVHSACAVSLNLEKDFFDKCNSRLLQAGNFSKLRSLFYPPVQDVYPGLIRCGEHADYGTMTFLFQDDLGGLEVKAADGNWIQAKSIPDTILVNVGDLMEIFTNGLFPATRHRVVVPEAEALRRQPRQSFVFFIHPNDETLVEPIHGQKPLKSKYNPITAGDHTRRQFSKTYKF